MMRAVVIREHGGIDKLVYEPAYRDPVLGTGDILVRVRACTLNYHDVFTRRGMPGIKIPFPLIMGIDAAGDVAALGPGVTGLAIGERVLIDPIDRVDRGFMGETFDGGLAEFVRVPAHMSVKLPASIGYAEAAALPTAYGTAHRMILERGKLRAGETILILGASGGVGTCCVQLAKRAGARVVVAASSAEKLERLKALGADIGIDYAGSDWVAECHRLFGRARTSKRDEGGVDVVVNFTGGETWTKALRVLRRQGRMLTCGATAGYDPPEDIRFIWTFELEILGSNGWTRADVEALLGMVGRGELRPALHPERFPLTRAADAMRALEDRTAFGKVVIEP
jgi:alcohol dehydrogenase